MIKTNVVRSFSSYDFYVKAFFILFISLVVTPSVEAIPTEVAAIKSIADNHTTRHFFKRVVRQEIFC
jgi:hypothetical protein